VAIFAFILEDKKNHQVVSFITNNFTDFFEEKGKEQFLHPDLRHDVGHYSIENKFSPYISLKAFVESVIDTKTHAFNHEEFEDEYGNEIEDAASTAALEYLNALPLIECRMLLEEAGYPNACTALLSSFQFDDYEGVEDPEVVSISDVGDGNIFIQYRFNLLSVRFEGIVPTKGYFSKPDMFDRYFLNVTSRETDTEIDSYPRIYFDASIIFDRKNEEVLSVSIDSATLRYRV
jgi:hypothetical protein